MKHAHRKLLTQEEYRKQQRNARWLHTAIIAIPVILAAVSCVAGLYMWWSHGHR